MSALGKLVASLTLDTAEFVGGVKKSDYEAQKFAQNMERNVGRSMQSVTKSLKGFAISAVGVVAGITSVSAAMGKLNSTFAALDQAAKDSQRLGIPIEQLTALQHAAELSGVETDKLKDALKDLNKNVADAANGTAAQVEVFKALGVSVKDANGNTRAAAEVLNDVADVLSNFPDGAQKSAIAMKVFGESGLQLIPLLNAGKDGIEAMKKEAADLGIVMEADTAKSAEMFNDNLSRLSATIDGLYIQSAGNLLPTLIELTDTLLSATRASEGFGYALQGALSVKFGDLLSSDSDVQRAAALAEEIAELEAKQSRGELSDNFFVNSPAIGVFGALIDSTNDLKQARAELAIIEKRINENHCCPVKPSIRRSVIAH